MVRRAGVLALSDDYFTFSFIYSTGLVEKVKVSCGILPVVN